MRSLAAVPVALSAVLAVLAGCAAPERACTMIAALSGVSVRVDPSLAPDVASLRLTVCWADRCVTRPVELAPGSDTVDGGCTGPDPDDSCSASATPNGSMVGFLEVTELAAGPVRVSATAMVSGRARRFPEVTVTAAVVYPNGPDCGGSGTQAEVMVSANGLR